MVEYYEARALFDYTPATADELQLRAGESVEVRIDRSGADDDVGEEGWLSGSDLLGNHGLFPANYVIDSRAPANPSNTSGGHGDHVDHGGHVVASNKGKPVVVGQEKERGRGGGGGGVGAGQPGQQQQYGRNGNGAHTPPSVLPAHGYSNNVAASLSSSGRGDSSTGITTTTAALGGGAAATPSAYHQTAADRARQAGHQNGGAPAAGGAGVLPPGKHNNPDRDRNAHYGDRNAATAAAASAHTVAPGTSLPGPSSHDHDAEGGGDSYRLREGWFTGTDEATGLEYYYSADGQTSWVRPLAAVLGEPLAAENELASVQGTREGSRVSGGRGGGGGATSSANSKYVSTSTRNVFHYVSAMIPFFFFSIRFIIFSLIFSPSYSYSYVRTATAIIVLL